MSGGAQNIKPQKAPSSKKKDAEVSMGCVHRLCHSLVTHTCFPRVSGLVPSLAEKIVYTFCGRGGNKNFLDAEVEEQLLLVPIRFNVSLKLLWL